MTNRLLRFAAVAAAMVMVTVAVQRAASAQGIGGRSGSDSRGQQALDDGRKALESDDFANAEQKFREAISLDPKLNDAYWRLAAILYGKKEYAKSVQLLRSAPDQQDLDIREQLGLALYKTANPPPAESIRLLEDVVSKRPDSYAAQLQLGQHLVRTEPTRAAAAIEVYLRYRPPSAASLDPQIHMVLGTAYVYARDWDAAQKEFEGLLRTKPNDMTAKLMLGSVLVGKGSCSQAISLYERILSRGAAAAEHVLQPRHLLSAREARGRRLARGRAVQPRQADRRQGPRAHLRRALRSAQLSARAHRVPAGGAGGSGQRHHQGPDRPHLPRHAQLSVGGHLPRAGRRRR